MWLCDLSYLLSIFFIIFFLYLMTLTYISYTIAYKGNWFYVPNKYNYLILSIIGFKLPWIEFLLFVQESMKSIRKFFWSFSFNQNSIKILIRAIV